MREASRSRLKGGPSRPHRLSRVLFGLALGAAAVIAFLLWSRREPSWSVVIDADSDSATPWETVHLTAKIAPRHVLETPGWRWTWQDNGETFATQGSDTEWKGSTLGRHELSLVAQSPWGTKKTATRAVNVLYKEFVSPVGIQSGATLTSEPMPPELPFGIKDVWVEKSSVCMGEPSRIRITPFDKRGDEKWLTPSVGGAQAWETAFVAPVSEPGMRSVRVQVVDYRNDTESAGGVASTYVMIEVKDCVAPFPMYVTQKPIPPDQEDVRFDLQLFDGPQWVNWARGMGRPTEDNRQPTAKATAFRWNFGDGVQAMTAEPTSTHKYPEEGDRPDEATTSYAVKVEALDAAGAVKATAYTTVLMRNLLREVKHTSGVVQLVTEQTPWSTKNEDGSRTVELTVFNIDAVETAHLAPDVEVSLKDCDGEKVTPRTMALTTVFQDAAVPPRGRIHGRFTLPKEDVDAICWADAKLKGTSSPGDLTVAGFFTLDAGKQSQSVGEDKNKLLAKAMDLLGHPEHITMDDVRRLEEQGKLPRGALTPGK